MYCRRCNCRPYRGGQSQRGAALVVALLIFAVSAALVVAMKSEFTRYFARTANILLAEQAHAYLRGAEDLASMVLLRDWDSDKEAGLTRDDLTEAWAFKGAPYALDEGGWMTGSIEDLQGRFNLNALAERITEPKPGEFRFTAAQAQFIRLLQALEEPEVSEYEAILITEAVSDWLDADGNASADGAEDDYYYGLDPAYRAANRPMASVSELRSVANITPQIYQALAPWVTVWPRDPEKMNIHTAPAMLLRTLNTDKDLSPLSESDVESLVQYREETGFVDKADFRENPVFSGKKDKMTQAFDLLGESSSYFLLQAEVEVAERNMRLYSVLHRDQRAVSALARASGSL